MTILVVGLNHKSSPLSLRQELAVAPQNLACELQSLALQSWCHEVALLSTCNRTEWYCHIAEGREQAFARWMQSRYPITDADWASHFYVHQDTEAVMHMARVACGLDSLVMGEPQILGQMKSAYRLAKDLKTISQRFERLFQHLFAVAKRVRTQTALGENAVSVAYAAVRLAKQIFADLRQTRVLLIGAGDTIERVFKHLLESDVSEVVVANRTIENAQALVQRLEPHNTQLTACHLSEIQTHLSQADLVFSSTASALPILGKGAVESALNSGKRRPLFMVDLAVPPDIEPEVAQLEDVYLYSVDDLQEVIEENKRLRETEAKLAEALIEQETQGFLGWVRSLDSVHLIRAYQSQVAEVREKIEARAKRLLKKGVSPEEVLTTALYQCSKALTHTPSKEMRDAGFAGDTQVLENAKRLLGIWDQEESQVAEEKPTSGTTKETDH